MEFTIKEIKYKGDHLIVNGQYILYPDGIWYNLETGGDIPPQLIQITQFII